MNVSIVTATYRSYEFKSARQSVLSQSFPVQHVVIDGYSGEPWYSQIRSTMDDRMVFVSEPDDGIYDAINKGIKRADGDVVGILHSDDTFADTNVVRDVVNCFQETDSHVVYGDLDYVNARGRRVRHWQAGHFHPKKLVFGWMPAHPAMFRRKDVFDMIGGYNTLYRIAGDYEFILRLLKVPHLNITYLPRTITHMKLGGSSNKNFKHIFIKIKEDYHAMKTHSLSPLVALPAKNLRKVPQLLSAFSAHR